jgi:hypothetical protein
MGSANDESPLAEQLAAQLGTRHATVMVRKADFIEQREQLLAAMDQPSIDGVNTWFVSQAAASQGIKVALSGLGGDELFASYPSFADLPRIRNLARPFGRCPTLGNGLRQFSLSLRRRITTQEMRRLAELFVHTVRGLPAAWFGCDPYKCTLPIFEWAFVVRGTPGLSHANLFRYSESVSFLRLQRSMVISRQTGPLLGGPL